MIKITKRVILLIALTINMTACSEYLEELNVNPTTTTSIDMNAQLTYAQLLTWGDWMTVQTFNYYLSAFVQQMQGEWNTTQYGGTYRIYNSMMSDMWERIYTKPIKNLEDAIYQSGDEQEWQNVKAICRVMRVYYYMLLTDTFGDVPYSQAGQGLISDIIMPEYDSQESIYYDMLDELEEVVAELDETAESVTGDVIYQGDVAMWRKLANSIRLRAAMRLVKVDPDTAMSQVVSLLSSTDGLLSSEDEDALIVYLDINDWSEDEFRRNALAQTWRTRDAFATSYVCSTTWNYLTDTSDPRLLRMFRMYYQTVGAESDPFSRQDITEEVMAWGLAQPVKPGFYWYDSWPSGYWDAELEDWIDQDTRPMVNNQYMYGSAPGVIMTFAEVELLLADAAVRWPEVAALVDAQSKYQSGVGAAMDLLAKYGIDSVTDDEKTAYFAANAFPSDSEAKLEVINSQLWLLHFNNAPEAYSNWRRSGYPTLLPACDHGAVTIDSQEIPRRLNYPTSEASYNAANYQAAIAKMGGKDDWNQRVWWDI